jgi:ATP-dependent helicase/nuclease subunit A
VPASDREPQTADAPVIIQELPALPRRERPAATAGSGDDTAARLGQAVHRVLEWHLGGGEEIEPLAAAAATEFGLGADVAAEVHRLAQAMLDSPEGARFFRDPAIEWAGNEVPLSLDGEALRVDRLVARRERNGRRVWWILDYKLRHQPQQLAAYSEQMRRYREAVRRAQPDDEIRCAFVTGAGEVVELEVP